MLNLWIALLLLLFNMEGVFIPVAAKDRKLLNAIQLTEIGAFGLVRKARPGVKEHLHTGIDIRRLNDNYENDSFIYPISNGTIISKRSDGPYAQLIIEHQINEKTYWTVYEHIAGIMVDLYQPVSPQQPIARFFNREELDQYGWQFDHFHFEILKQQPLALQPNPSHPDRRFASYTLSCFELSQLNNTFYHPLLFFEAQL